MSKKERRHKRPASVELCSRMKTIQDAAFGSCRFTFECMVTEVLVGIHLRSHAAFSGSRMSSCELFTSCPVFLDCPVAPVVYVLAPQVVKVFRPVALSAPWHRSSQSDSFCFLYCV